MPNIGDPAPDFTGYDVINQKTYTLSQDFGNVIVLTFLAYT